MMKSVRARDETAEKEANEMWLSEVSINDELCMKNEELCIKNEFVFVFNTSNGVSKTRNCVLKMMNFAELAGTVTIAMMDATTCIQI